MNSLGEATEPRAELIPLGAGLEGALHRGSPWIVLGMIVALLLIHLRAAGAVSLDPDEAMHFVLAHQKTVGEAYRASNSSAHPPLLALLLYFSTQWSTAELFLRLPMILGHCALVWLAWRWMDRTAGRAAALACAALMAFVPPLSNLAVEVRHYMLMLPLLMAALATFERGVDQRCAPLLVTSALLLDLGILADYSALWFVAGFGVYSLWRVLARRLPRRAFVAWAAGQLSAVALYVFLYVTHLAATLSTAQPHLHRFQHFRPDDSWLRFQYLRPGDSVLAYAIRNPAAVFEYLFGSRLPGWVAAALFAGALVLISRKAARPLRPLLALFLVPLLANLAVSLRGAYPFGGTRHSVIHGLVILPAVAFALARLARGRLLVLCPMVAGLVALVVGLAGPDAMAIPPEDAKPQYVAESVRYLREVTSPRAIVLTDYQTLVTLCYYYDPLQYCVDSGDGHFCDVPLDGLHIVSSRFYALEPASLAEEWRIFEREYDPGPDVDVWSYDAGWAEPLSEELLLASPGATTLPGLATFGPKIGVFRIR